MSSLLQIALLLSPVLALPTDPVVGVVVLPTVPLAEENVSSEPAKPPVRPVSPGRDADESAQQNYREVLARFEAAEAAHRAQIEQLRLAQRQAREAVRQRQTADRSATRVAGSAEYTLRALKIFNVVSAYRARTTLARAELDLEACVDPKCFASLATRIEVPYLLVLRGLAETNEVAITLVRAQPGTDDGPGVATDTTVLGREQVPSGGSARNPTIALMTPVREFERDRATRDARVAAEGADWAAVVAAVERCLRLDDRHGPCLFFAGRGLFRRGDLGGAERRLRESVEEGFRVGEAELLRGKIALRRGKERTAVGFFKAAIEAGTDDAEARVVLARAADAGIARGHLERAVALAPGHGEANFRLAQVLHAEANNEAAAESYRRALAAGYRLGASHLGLGEIALGQKKWDEATVHLEAAREGGEASVEAVHRLGDLYLARKDPGRALECYLEARRRGIRTGALDITLGKAAQATGDWGNAATAWKRALRDAKTQLEANRLLANLYLAQDNPAAAARYFATLIEAGEDSVTARITIARAALASRRPQDARAALEKILELEPQHGEAAYWLAEMEREAGDWARATQLYTVAVAGNYRPGNAHWRLGEYAASRGDMAQRDRHYLAAAGAKTREPSVYRHLGRRANQEGDSRRAREFWGALLELEPRDPEANLRLGRIRLGEGDIVGARPLLEVARGSSTHAPAARRALGFALREVDPEEAWVNLEAAVASGDADFELLLAAGQLAARLGHTDEARPLLQRALAFRPGDGEVALTLADVHLRGRRWSQARVLMARALSFGILPRRIAATGQTSVERGEMDAARMVLDLLKDKKIDRRVWDTLARAVEASRNRPETQSND